MDVNELIDNINAQVEEFLQTLNTMSADDVQASGLDSRAVNRHETWYNDECVVVAARNQRVFEYYGGMEYHDREFVRSIGDYVAYTRDENREQCRVARILDGINHANADEHDEESDEEQVG